jgi:hypothetical protein
MPEKKQRTEVPEMAPVANGAGLKYFFYLHSEGEFGLNITDLLRLPAYGIPECSGNALGQTCA